MADALLLSSQRCRPSRLLEAGFTFEHPELDAALRAMVPK
jgi:NAD dependent epimerase/dehydratase family enzyme